MSEIVAITAEEQRLAEELAEELPSQLPVLPLKDAVVFPNSMTPLAIGQERSIALVDDVLSGDRLLALVFTANEDVDVPGEKYSFGTLVAAQALGDFESLDKRNRRGIRIHFPGDVKAGLAALAAAVDAAVSAKA